MAGKNDITSWPPCPPELKVSRCGLPNSYSKHAFISYCEDDSRLAQQLSEIITDNGFQCCHLEGQTGTLCDVITQAVKQSRVVLALVTTSLVDSNDADNLIALETANRLATFVEKDTINYIVITHAVTGDAIPDTMKERPCRLDTADPQFWSNLFSILKEPVVKQEILPVGNIAYGLCWSYLCGYLALVLPGLRDKMMQSDFTKKGIPFLTKMVVVIPQSAKIPRNFADENIERHGFLEFEGYRAGKKNRDYKTNVYQITDPTSGEKYMCVLEYCSVISIMAKDVIKSLTDEQRIKQLELFQNEIEKMTEHPFNNLCNKRVLFVAYDDTEEFPEKLSGILSNVIRSDPDTQKSRID